MSVNTAEVLNRGITYLLEKMDVVDTENFIFLVKTENFDYTKWQRNYFDSKSREDIDMEMEVYFAEHPYNGDTSKII